MEQWIIHGTDILLLQSILNLLSIMIASSSGLSEQMIGSMGGPGAQSPASRMSIHEIPTAGPD